MIHTLQNAYLQFSFDSDTCTWNVLGPHSRGPSVENAQVNVRYHRGFSRGLLLGDRGSLRAGIPRTTGSVHGPLRQLEILSGLDPNGLSLSLTFALPDEHPLLLWKLSIANQGSRPVFIDRIDLLNAGFIYLTSSFSLPSMTGFRFQYRPARGVARPAQEPGELAFFSNGWQSWSYTGVYGPRDRYRITRLGPLRLPTEYSGTPHPQRAGVFASDMFGVLGDREHRTALLAGFLSQKQHFGSLEVLMDVFSPALRMYANGEGARLDPGKTMETDWACLYFLHLDTSDPLGPYLEAVARENQLPAARRTPAGWCSWYGYSSPASQGTITAEALRENLGAMERLRGRLPLEILQVDDGYQEKTGDWLATRAGFPEGMAPLAREIRRAGFTPGLWLAPFIVHPKSRLAHDHPDWLLRRGLFRRANAGYFWNSFTTALDLTHGGALEYVQEVVHAAVREWGYSYLKLDFLYAAALPGRRRDPTRTGAQVLRKGLEALRQAAGEETFLLGCACPLGTAIGLVDGMRIGTDTAERWRPAYRGRGIFLGAEPNLPSARLACHNALTRAALHQRWWINDPDCLLLSPDTHLTQAEVQSIATIIALTGGSFMLSDPLPGLPDERLRLAEALLPLIGKTPYVLDWFDTRLEAGAATPSRIQLDLDGPAGRWHLLALFNWGDQPDDLILRPNDFYLESRAEYRARSFWDGRLYRIFGQPLVLKNVPPHGVILLAARPARAHQPLYLGSDLHISQGLELSGWTWDSPSQASQTDGRPGKLSFRLERPGPARGVVALALPDEPREVLLNGSPTSWQSLEAETYRVDVEFTRQAEVVVRF